MGDNFESQRKNMKYYNNLWISMAFTFFIVSCSNEGAQSNDADKELMLSLIHI